jgi:hypothetical protein
MGRIANYDKKVWNTYKQALTPALSITKGTGVSSVAVSNGLKSFVNGDLITIGDTYTITATPSSGYAHSALLINGVVKANPATVTITDNQFSVVAQASDILFDLSTTLTGCTLVISDGVNTYEAGSNIIPKDTELTITATASEGYTLDGMTFTINDVAFTNGSTTSPITANVSIVATATAIALVLPLVGEIDFNTNSTWDSGNEFYLVDTVPELDFSSVADGDVNLKITVTLDGTPIVKKGTRFSIDNFIAIGDLFEGEGLISVASGVKIGLYEGIGANVDTIALLAPENYLLTHTVVLNSIEIDENIEEILSADISYAWNSGDSKFEGTITDQTLDVSGLTNEQDNIYTYWEIDNTSEVTRYLVPATPIISGTTTSLQESALLDSIAITLNVNAKIIDTNGTLTTEITGSALTGTEVITLLAVFIQNSPT